MFLSQDEAQAKINQRLEIVGLSPISKRSMYRLRDVYIKTYPRSRWMRGERLIYGEPIVLFLYFLARLHQAIASCLAQPSYRATEIALAQFTEQSLPKGTRFSEVFKTFSDVDTFFTTRNQSAA